MKNSLLISNLRTVAGGRRAIWPYVVAAVMMAYVIVLLYLVVSDIETTTSILRGM